ncbi:MAG: outer membrane lipoprotein-sorting protein [Deltaproteobacteria bacterium]|nr:outer membrane lipoprotein-sorting protein [Deltaproteobacteria bacterium]
MIRLSTLLILALGLEQAAFAESAESIAARASENSAFSASHSRATLQMVLYRDGSRYRERRLTVITHKSGSSRRSRVTFLGPADISGTKFLSLEPTAGDTQQFLYLPAFKKVKRIVGTERHKPFVQSDFSYADLEGFDADDWRWRSLPDGDYKGEGCFVLEAVPKNSVERDYGKVMIWVHKKNLVALAADYYDKPGATVIKRYWAEKLAKRDDRWIPTSSFLETSSERTKTELRVESIDFKSQVPESEFDQAALER